MSFRFMGFPVYQDIKTFINEIYTGESTPYKVVALSNNTLSTIRSVVHPETLVIDIERQGKLATLEKYLSHKDSRFLLSADMLKSLISVLEMVNKYLNSIGSPAKPVEPSSIKIDCKAVSLSSFL